MYSAVSAGGVENCRCSGSLQLGPVAVAPGDADGRDAVLGGTDDPRRNTKGKVIAWALREYGVDPSTAVMVGDREHDIHGAAENGIPAIGVSWGYGDRAELEGAGATAVFDTAEEVVNYIIRG